MFPFLFGTASDWQPKLLSPVSGLFLIDMYTDCGRSMNPAEPSTAAGCAYVGGTYVGGTLSPNC